MRHGELFYQALHSPGFFNRVQVFSLQILDETDHHSVFIRQLAHYHRHSIKPRLLSGTPAALTGNDFIIPTGQLTGDDGLQHTLLGNGVGEIIKRLFIHLTARLKLPSLQQLNWQLLQFIRRNVTHSSAIFTQQCV